MPQEITVNQSSLVPALWLGGGNGGIEGSVLTSVGKRFSQRKSGLCLFGHCCLFLLKKGEFRKHAGQAEFVPTAC